MDDVFRFPAALRRDAAVEAWLASREPALRPLALAWFERLRALGPDVRELMHDGCATACVEDVALAHVGVYRAHVSLYFFRGAHLEDPAGLLEGTGKQGRHVKLRLPAPSPRVAIPSPERERALETLLQVAYRDARLRVSSASR